MSKTNNGIWSSINDVPLSFFLTWAIQAKFWEMLDKDFGREIDNESVHQIFELLFKELNEKQLINILNQIDPEGLSKIQHQINEKKISKKAFTTN
tara:strand:- start:536 stop:820 length:285 start_codon:yes stop_codon:yes gene_type:complete